MVRFMDYLYIAATISFTVYGQFIIKLRIAKFGSLPVGWLEKLKFLMSLFCDPGILSGLAAAFLASLAWMVTMIKFELSHVYPFISLNFVAVLLLSGWFLGEPVTLQKMLGVGFIVFGTAVAVR